MLKTAQHSSSVKGRGKLSNWAPSLPFPFSYTPVKFSLKIMHYPLAAWSLNTLIKQIKILKFLNVTDIEHRQNCDPYFWN